MSQPTTYTACGQCGQMNRVPFDPPANQAPVCGKCKATLAVHGGITDVTPVTLQKLIQKSPLPVIVDFWAPWCGPCRAFAPTFQQSAKSLAGRAVFVKLDTEQHPGPSQQFGVRGIPTLMVFDKGQEKARQAGALPLDSFMQWTNSVLT